MLPSRQWESDTSWRGGADSVRNRVLDSRREKEWSQQRLADVLGVSRQTIISIERGKFDPSLPLAFRMAALFECRIEELFFPEN